MHNVNYPKLFRPGLIGKMPVKNRIVLPPCTTNFAGPSGRPTERLIAYYAERARGGVGLIIVENTQVKYPEGKNVSCQLRLDNDKYIPDYGELAEALHVYDAKVFQQIHHAGRQPHETEGVQPVAPSPLPCGFLQIPVRELTDAEIWDLIERFSETALRAKKAGMDGVELHGAHGYLIGQFNSPYTNKRVDQWGGSFERRIKFLLEIIKRTRAKVGPDFPLCLRFSADEFVPGGITLEDGKKIAAAAEAAGINILHVSAGIYESMPTLLEPMRFDEGWRVYLAEEIKKQVKIPVITVGQIKTPQFAERILEQNRADFIALGRPLIADPEWPKKALEGREEEIRKCISCNIGCIGGRVFLDMYMRCTVNPVVGREKEAGWIRIAPAKEKKKVMVVGAGPGGLEAARVSALRGHDVTLYEKEKEIGGQLKIGSVPPGKDKLKYINEYYAGVLAKSGVKLELGKTVDEKLMAEVKPDAVIVATGAEPMRPKFSCAFGNNVLNYADLLNGSVTVQGRKVVVAGGGSVGAETALFLAQQGKDVTIVEMRPDIATDVEVITRFDLLTAVLPKAGVKVLTRLTILEITAEGVKVIAPEGEQSLIEADDVVVAVGSQPTAFPAEKIKETASEVYLIGDSKSPRQIIDAIYEGALAARLI